MMLLLIYLLFTFWPSHCVVLIDCHMGWGTAPCHLPTPTYGGSSSMLTGLADLAGDLRGWAWKQLWAFNVFIFTLFVFLRFVCVFRPMLAVATTCGCWRSERLNLRPNPSHGVPSSHAIYGSQRATYWAGPGTGVERGHDEGSCPRSRSATARWLSQSQLLTLSFTLSFLRGRHQWPMSGLAATVLGLQGS